MLKVSNFIGLAAALLVATTSFADQAKQNELAVSLQNKNAEIVQSMIEKFNAKNAELSALRDAYASAIHYKNGAEIVRNVAAFPLAIASVITAPGYLLVIPVLKHFQDSEMAIRGLAITRSLSKRGLVSMLFTVPVAGGSQIYITQTEENRKALDGKIEDLKRAQALEKETILSKATKFGMEVKGSQVILPDGFNPKVLTIGGAAANIIGTNEQ